MRVAVATIGFVSAIFFSPILTGACIIILAVRYDAWEAILLGFMMDMLWTPTSLSMTTLPYFTIAAIIVVWALSPLRAQFLR